MADRNRTPPNTTGQICEGCGVVFDGRKRRFCTGECRTESKSENASERRKLCAGCGIEFPYETSKQQFCTPQCCAKTRYERRHNKPVLTCEGCGLWFQPKMMDRVKYCSRECYREVVLNRVFMREFAESYKRLSALSKDCASCGKPFDAPTLWDKYCSQKCRHRRVPPIRDCAVCGLWFELGRSGYRKCCSRRCFLDAGLEARQAAKRRREARLAGVRCEPYSRTAIFKRDGWRCGICGKKVSRNRKVPHPKAPTIDHIKAIAEGGADAPNNVQCAHFACNSNKGARDGYQMLLFA